MLLATIKKASHLSMKRFRDPDWIRTNDPQLRRLMLYPAELPDPLLVFLRLQM